MTEQNEAGCLIAVDWGTTNFRAWLLGPGGQVRDRVEAPRGVSHVEQGGFVASLRSLLGAWLNEMPQVPVLMAGMVGSADGWIEAPYLPCPIDIHAIAGSMVTVAGLDEKRAVYVVPGLDTRPLGGGYDVMRGEEVQIVGALEATVDDRSKLFCVPGTHSKWVEVSGRRIQGFSTSMTGDAYKALRDHSFLARSINGGEQDSAAFERGLDQARRAGGLLHHLFSVRTTVLKGDLAAQSAASYLSGILIGSEVGTMLAAHAHGGDVTVVGGRLLAPLYAQAIRFCDRNVICIDGEEAAYKGLYRLATSMEIIDV